MKLIKNYLTMNNKPTLEEIIQLLERAIKHLENGYLSWANAFVTVALNDIRKLEKLTQ